MQDWPITTDEGGHRASAHWANGLGPSAGGLAFCGTGTLGGVDGRSNKDGPAARVSGSRDLAPCSKDTGAPAPAPVWGTGLCVRGFVSSGDGAGDMGTPLAVRYRAGDGTSLGADAPSRIS